MDLPLNAGALLFLLVFVALSSAFYLRRAFHARAQGGRVIATRLEFPDLLVSIVLATFLGLLALQGFLQKGEPAPLKAEQVLPSSFFLLTLAGGIAVFLRYRGIRLRKLTGMDLVPAWRALIHGGYFLLAALPLIAAAGAASGYFLQVEGGEQELVKLFKDVARQGNHTAILQILTAGVLIAPPVEEFLFRGYFYPVLKRYLGAVPSALLTAALFSAFHVNVASLAGLFILALCFTLAYEVSGSLFVPICMHALFNGANLLLLYFFSQNAPA